MIFLLILMASLFLILAWLESPTFESPFFKYLRVFFPSWKFFGNLSPIPIIYYRTRCDDHDYTLWIKFPAIQHTRRLRNLFHNPDVNLDFNFQVQLEQLLEDLTAIIEPSKTKPEDLMAFKIVSSYIRERIRPLAPSDNNFFQFKISIIEFPEPSQTSESHMSDVLYSAEMDL